MGAGQKMIFTLKKYSFFLVLMACGLSAQSQNLAQHNWYFGNSTNAIRFNRATNKAFTVNNKAVPFGTGGSAVATDPATANLLFYTDGAKVYNTNHIVMPNGSGLTANTLANQPSVICPVPGDPTKYFIFTNTANYTAGGSISVTVVDMASFGGSVFPSPPLGDIFLVAGVPQTNISTGLIARSEGMTVIPHSNGIDYFLVTHQNGTQTYAATLITAASYSAGAFAAVTNTTAISSPGLGLNTSVANFSYNRKNKKLAVSAQNANTDAIILTFNDATGALTFDRSILNSGTATVNPQSIYDIQWDNAGQYIYFSRVGEPGITADVLQYDYKNPAITLASVLKVPEFRSWGLQLAPDSAIYHIYQALAGGPFLVEKFTKTDTVASSVIQTALPFGAVDFKGTQFPAFLTQTNVILTLSFTSSGSCQNNNTTFFPNVLPNADSLHWDFGDGKNATDWSPVHKYTTAQTFNVTLTAYYQGKKQTVTQPVTINAFTLKLQLVSDTTACRSEFPPPRGSSTPKQFSVKVKVSGGSATSYNWSNGQTGATLKPDSAGYYYVVVTDASGCSAYAGVNVKEYKKIDQRSNIWYFGNKAGIDFNKQPPKALSNSLMNAPAGCAIVCDRNGQTIFYTDGDQVWDKTNTSIASGIGGDPSSSQSSLIISVPGDETLYYIFTTQAINGVSGNELRYSLFDLKLNSGKGGIVQKNILMFAKSTERITANGNWLVAHEYGNTTFRVYKITAQGIGDPVYSAIGSDHSFQFAANGEGYMKLGPKNNLAVALSTPGTTNVVELFHLNDSTGRLTYYRKIDLKHPAGQVYGIEFSPGGNKLFASVMGAATADIFEYSIDSIGKPHFKKDNVEPAVIGALQLAPDNQIYFAIKGSTNLGTFTADEDTTKITVGINLNGFALAAGTNSNIGLPNFRQQQGSGFGGPGFTYTGICLGDTTKFVGTPTDPIDKFQWFFGDGASSTKSSPNHLYAAAGTYSASMRLTNRCGLDTTITKKIKINAPPAKPSLALAVPICTVAVTLDANKPNTPGLTYLWSTGATTKTISISKPSIVAVTNTDVNGCFSSAQTAVVDNRPQVVLGPDLTVCQNTAVPALDAQNPSPGITYAWTINAVPSSTSQFQGVSTTVAGAFIYKVIVTDALTGCQTAAQKIFTVIASPAFTMTGTNPTTCMATDGTISLTGITSPSLYSYFLTGPGGFNKQGIDQVAATQGPFVSPPPIAAGTYSGIITDQVSGCTISNSFGLSNPTYTATPSTIKFCDPPIIKITSTAVALPLQYLVTNNSSGQATSGSNPSAIFNIQLPSQGSSTTVLYTIQITDNAGCISITNNFSIATTPPIPLSITSPGCGNTITANPAGYTYSWSSNVVGSIIGSSSLQTVTLQPGQMLLTVTGTDASGCSTSITQQVNISPAIAPAFTQSDPCQNSAVLIAAPVGNYTYRWYENGSVAPTQIGQQIVVTLADNGLPFILEVVDAQSGCTIKSSPAKNASVLGTINASVTATLACNDGKPFTLTAATIATSPTYAWLLNGSAIANASSATLQQTSEGTYQVDITQATCKASASIQVSKAPIPQGRLPSGAVICNDPDNHDPKTLTVKLDPGFFSAYNWFKNDVSLTYTARVYTADSQGSYKVDLTNVFGCTNSNKISVTNDCEPIVTGPNAFRPGSGHNENKNFHLFTFFVTDNFEVVVYNRWGEAVFESKDRNFQWNGSYKNNGGQLLPGGTYVYLVRYVSSFHPDQGVQELRGGVVLLR